MSKVGENLTKLVGDTIRSWERSTHDEDAFLAAQVALSYLLFGVLWIILSDRLVASVANHPAILSRIQTLKGWAFVAATAVFLYLLVRSAVLARRKLRRRKDETDRFLRTLLANIPGVAYACRDDPDWTMIYVSDGVAGLTGYTAEELTGQGPPTYGDLIIDSDRQRVWDEVRRALVGRRTFKLDYHIRTKDGNVRRVWEQGQGVYGEGGSFRRLEGFICDVTDLAQLPEQVRSA
ncbi:MAG: PAS domain-containing protein [Gemmatimonadota bacterium]